MAKRFVTTTVMMLMAATCLAADQGAAKGPSRRGLRPLWTFVGIGAGFGTGLWAGLTAFDDSINSEQKVWSSAVVGAAAGGVLGYLIDRHQARSQAAPRTTSRLLLPPRDERDLIVAASSLGNGQLRRWLDAGVPLRPRNCVGAVSSIP